MENDGTVAQKGQENKIAGEVGYEGENEEHDYEAGHIDDPARKVFLKLSRRIHECGYSRFLAFHIREHQRGGYCSEYEKQCCKHSSLAIDGIVPIKSAMLVLEDLIFYKNGCKYQHSEHNAGLHQQCPPVFPDFLRHNGSETL